MARSEAKLLLLLAAVLILSPLLAAGATTLTITTPAVLEQGTALTAVVSIQADTAFSGTAYLAYGNINSTITEFSFAPSSFSGSSPYELNYAWSVAGIQPGAYFIYANLTNSTGVAAASNRSGIVNSSAPVILLSSPSGTVSKRSVVLSVTTNEPAACRYDTANSSYENMTSTFSYTGAFNHNQTLNDLSEGLHVYHVRCQDAAGYAMNSTFEIRFTVDLPPEAQISLSDPSPVRAGTIEVAVVTSESLPSPPALEYSFNDAPATRRQVSLTGANSIWKGYLIITEGDDNKVGTFFFTGTDSAGNTGTAVTGGKLFLVDTTKPAAPLSIKALSEPDGSIRVEWYSEGDSVGTYQLYRATTPGADYIDLYASTNATQYIDRSAIDKVTYYYRVAAVDSAGNVGLLSNEVYVTALNLSSPSSGTKSSEEASSLPKVLPPNLVVKVDASIKRVDSLLIDVEDAAATLGSYSGEQREMVAELKLMDKVEAGRAKLSELKGQLSSLKLSYATEAELDRELSKIELETKKIRKTTPEQVDIVEKTEFVQAVGKADIVAAVDELLSGRGMSEPQKAEYVSITEKLQQKIKVETRVLAAGLRYLDGSTEERTLVDRKILLDGSEPLQDAVAIEILPKSAVESSGEIEFLTEGYEVVKDDPVLKWGILTLGHDGRSIKYAVNRKVDSEEAKKSRVVVLAKLNEIGTAPGSITGFSSIPSLPKAWGLASAGNTLLLAGILTIVMLGGYYFVVLKGYPLARQRSPSRSQPLQKERSGLEAQEHINEYVREIYPLVLEMHGILKAREYEKSSQVFYMKSLLEKADWHFRNEQYEEVVRLYPEIQLAYQDVPAELKPHFYRRCIQLHRRLSELSRRERQA
ncbi:MAG: fibronectin type III domain-containing protein [Candidatus Aenigmarchaeota archaeon]|nr:fibronectin type III domain-containing protein [Candidatus Aenigmarchaeota archaeon]